MLGLGGNIQNDKIPKRSYTSGSTLLDGTNDYLKIPDGDGFLELISPASTSWSLSFYFMVPGSGAPGGVQLIQKLHSAAAFFWVAILASGDLTVAATDLIDGAVAYRVNAAWDTNFVKGTWYHVVITSDRSGTNSDTLAYINGDVATRSVHTTTASNGDLIDAGADNTIYTTIGTFNVGAAHLVYYNFHFDELAVWNSVLTADEITEIADKYPNLTQNVGDYASSGTLLRYYRMGQDTSASAISIEDMSGNGGAPIEGINSPTTSTTKPY